jgi:hypothetical protein
VIGLFRRKNPGNAFLLLFYGLIVKFPIFLHPALPVSSADDSYLYSQVLTFLFSFTGKTPIVYSIISFLLMFLQASLFNRICNHHKLLGKSTFLPGMSFLLLTSFFPSWNFFSAPLLTNSLMVWVWYRMLNLYNSSQPGSAIFNIGVLIGVASMLYFPAIAFTLLMLFALVIMRPFRIREWIVGLIGVTIPYYFLFILLFLSDKWKWSIVFPKFRLSLPLIPTSIWITASMVLLVIPFIIGGFLVQANLTKMLIQVRKAWSLLLLYLLVNTLTIFVNADPAYQTWMLTAIPFAAFHSSVYFFPQQRLFPNLLHWISFAFVIILSYGPAAQ